MRSVPSYHGVEMPVSADQPSAISQAAVHIELSSAWLAQLNSLETEKVRDRARFLEQELRRFVHIVTQRMCPERIILFGSCASGEVKEWSDLDLVVVAQSDRPFYERLRRVVRWVEPRVGIDFFIYTPGEWTALRQARAFIRDEVEQKGRVLYERDLDLYYAPTRYPDAVAGALPGGLPQETEASRALSTAADVMVILVLQR